jgi:hypothetical protein
MKKVTLLLLTSIVLLVIPLSLAAQKAGQWTVGAGFQPFFYQKYNKSDWNNRPNSYPAKPRKFNGLAGAIALGYSFSDTWGVGAELAYSKQKQNYYTRAITITDLEGKETIYYTPEGSETRLDYLKFPAFGICNLELGYESGVYLHLIGGAQLSLNTNYHAELVQYGWDMEKVAPDYDVIKLQTVITPFHFHQDFREFDGSYSAVDQDTKYLYRRFELGVIAGAAIQKRIFQSYVLSLGARYELGLTDIENPKEGKHFITFSGQTGSYGIPNPRPATHNRRIVLDIGISRILD